jgi:hypothetical protein
MQTPGLKRPGVKKMNCGPQAPSPAMFEAVIWSYKQNTKLLYHQFLRRNKKICDPLPDTAFLISCGTGTPACALFRDARVAQPFPTLSNTPNPCLPERSAATMVITRLKMGAESKDPEDFYCTRTATGSSTDALSVGNRTHADARPLQYSQPLSS